MFQCHLTMKAVRFFAEQNYHENTKKLKHEMEI